MKNGTWYSLYMQMLLAVRVMYAFVCVCVFWLLHSVCECDCVCVFLYGMLCEGGGAEGLDLVYFIKMHRSALRQCSIAEKGG